MMDDTVNLIGVQGELVNTLIVNDSRKDRLGSSVNMQHYLRKDFFFIRFVTDFEARLLRLNDSEKGHRAPLKYDSAWYSRVIFEGEIGSQKEKIG